MPLKCAHLVSFLFQDKAHMFAPPNYNRDIKCPYLLTHRDKLGGIELGNNTLQNLQSTDKKTNRRACVWSVVHAVRAFCSNY